MSKKHFNESDVKISYEMDVSGKITATGAYKDKTIRAWAYVTPFSPIWTYELELDALRDFIIKNFYEMEDVDGV